ncbi:MAG: indole-3-glycerol phosphate synthase TrpC [Kiritimatiellaeota bacterium]|nr:indole-3-glycerol phosphate synthase TrpC [Kiritimatiellota bacterium]
MNILDKIVADKRMEITGRRRQVPLEQLCEQARTAAAGPDFVAALRAAPLGLIAEIKYRSPSAGVLREPFEPAAIARAYAAAGAQALSVLIDETYFGGGEAPFRAVRTAVTLPLLYKEFVVDEWQIWHARSLGASAVLLIAAVLEDAELQGLLSLSRAAGVAALLEVHDETDMRRAAASGARLIGINNRDLKTFATSLAATFRLQALAPAGCTLVSESGIRTPDDIRRLRAAGIHAVLVGESLLRQPDLQQAVRNLMGAPGNGL